LNELIEFYDVIVARSNGKIEIYKYQNANPDPTLCFEGKIESSVTSIDVGYITMANSYDIMLSCYDGKIAAIVDSKKFKRQGIMGEESKPIESEDPKRLKEQEKEKKDKIKELDSEVSALELELQNLTQETDKLLQK